MNKNSIRQTIGALIGVLVVVGMITSLVLFVGSVWADIRKDAMVRAACIGDGYADVIRYEPARMDFCIGVVDGEWSIKPVEMD